MRERVSINPFNDVDMPIVDARGETLDLHKASHPKEI